MIIPLRTLYAYNNIKEHRENNYFPLANPNMLAC